MKKFWNLSDPELENPIIFRRTNMTSCPKCSFEPGMRTGEFTFCPKCGERLPGLPQLSEAAWRRVQLADLVFSIARLVAPGLLGAGIALWFMGPAWFVYTETQTIRAISIGLIVGGPMLFVLALFARKLAEDIALRGAAKSSDKRPSSLDCPLRMPASTRLTSRSLLLFAAQIARSERK